MEKEYFDCQCDCSEHVLRFIVDPKDGEMWTEVYLNHWRPWYKRVWIAVKYVFGYKSSFGAFDCTLIRHEDYPRLKQLIEWSDAALKAKQETHE